MAAFELLGVLHRRASTSSAEAARQCEVPLAQAPRQTGLLPLIVGYMTVIPVAVAAINFPAYALQFPLDRTILLPSVWLHIFHL